MQLGLIRLLVDGQKWITNGHFAHYFTTAVRTDT
jgi:alkylation response protein AidB-like acyl-CoA dehydrogenase